MIVIFQSAEASRVSLEDLLSGDAFEANGRVFFVARLLDDRIVALDIETGKQLDPKDVYGATPLNSECRVWEKKP
ncbi:MAG TPA: hypothetical protein VMY37_40085 [Thermoguttaceae bacterium]|nr:hypothetical protein [Thermoguttaceae bacterium]